MAARKARRRNTVHHPTPLPARLGRWARRRKHPPPDPLRTVARIFRPERWANKSAPPMQPRQQTAANARMARALMTMREGTIAPPNDTPRGLILRDVAVKKAWPRPQQRLIIHE